MNALVTVLIDWPRRVAIYFTWAPPLVARIVVGWVFLWSGWGKLNALPQITENFRSWNIPYSYCVIRWSCRVGRAPQHGHRGKLLARALINRLRMVAIEFGM